MDVQVSIPPPPPPPPLPPAFLAETAASQVTTSPSPAPTSAQPATTTTTAGANVTSLPTLERNWLNPWTTAQMRENASQWSLAGDAGVLLYLEQFSERLTQRADAIQQHINQTVNAVKSTHTRVLNCLNEFTALANTQFIENRVYDEDETVDSTANASKKEDQSNDKSNANNVETQEKVLQRYAEAIQYGLAILDTHFERVEAKLDNNANGDSSFAEDEEETGRSSEPILELKDPYIDRPLPHLIGSSDFMDDDYVGLGTLLIVPEPEPYGLEQFTQMNYPESVESDSDHEDEKEDDADFQAQISPAPLVPAGASRPDLSNQSAPTKTISISSDDDDDDDPFKIGKKVTIMDSKVSKSEPKDDDQSDDELRKPPPSNSKIRYDFDSEVEDDNSTFGLPSKSTPTVNNKQPDSDVEDNTSISSKESEPPKPEKPKMVSELEKRVRQRRQEMDDDSDVPSGNRNDNDDDDNDKVIRKPIKTKTSTKEPSSKPISNIPSQPITAPPKISKPSIFKQNDDDDDDDDEDDFLNPKRTSSTFQAPPSTMIIPKQTQKKEKDWFDSDDDDDDDIFKPKPKTPASPAVLTKQNNPIPISQTIVVAKNKPIDMVDVDNDDDGFFAKPTSVPVPSTPAALKKRNSSQSDSDIFDSAPANKPPVVSTPSKPVASIYDDGDDDLLLTPSKPPEPKPIPIHVAAPLSMTKDQVKSGSNNDDELFGNKKKVLPSQKSVPLVKPNDDTDQELFPETKLTKPTTTPITPQKKISISSDEEDLFKSKPYPAKQPPTPILSPSSQAPVVQTAKPSPASTKQISSDDDNDADDKSSSERDLNPGALKTGEKLVVKNIASRLNFKPAGLTPGGSRPPLRQKAPSITEEAVKPSVDDDEDDQPIEKARPVPITVKKFSSTLSDTDDDTIFGPTKKKETHKVPVVEGKTETTNENHTERKSVKDIRSGIKLPMMPGVPPKMPPSTEATSNEEPAVDKAMINVLLDKAKVARPGRAPRSRNQRVADAAAAASNNDDDHFFSTSTPTPVAIPKASTPVSAVSPPSVIAPVTGSPNKPASLAAKKPNLKGNKKFSLFDSDDSDIDELLFGSKTKKNKSLAASKTTTTTTTGPKSSTKASVSLLNDDNDFLSKRPAKKTAKPAVATIDDDNDEFLSKGRPKKTMKPPADGNDIFADVAVKSQPVNKAKKDWAIMNKTEDKDDIFNDVSTKSSSNTSKSKVTTNNNKTAATKSLDDIFDDPLDVMSKR